MILILKDLILFVTAFVSFLYGTTIAWHCGRKSHTARTLQERRTATRVLFPCATLMYGFAIAISSGFFYELFLGYSLDELGRPALIAMDLLNALLLASIVTWLATPDSRRARRTVPAVTGLAPQQLARAVQPISNDARIRRP